MTCDGLPVEVLLFVKASNSADHIGLLSIRHLRVDRQSKGLVGRPFGDGKITPLMFQNRIAFLHMKGEWVIDFSTDSLLLQILPQPISLWNANHKLVKDVTV